MCTKSYFSKLCLLILLACTAAGLRAQTASISGVVNSYAPVAAITGSTVSTPTPSLFAAGDRVLLIQMKGATINTSNTAAYGDILAYNNAGNYEFATVSAVSPAGVTLTAVPTRTYTPAGGTVQLVRIPVYQNALVTGTLTAQAWNGQTGGVLAIQVNGTLTLNADVDVTGKGFRGGNRSGGNSLSPVSGFVSTSIVLGYKGEGISDAPLNLTGQGKSANAGGGGHSHNAGGGGGGHMGAGGNGKSTPLAIFGSGPGTAGIGGLSLNNNAGNRLFLGGGGGGGHQNDNHGQHGAPGGGIAIVSACTIIGNGFGMKANGGNTVRDISTNNDGGGGAGGGGSLLLQCTQLNGSLITDARGGNSAEVCCSDGDTHHGAGGGGGGGFVWYSGSSPLAGQTVSVAGGIGDRNAGEGNPGLIQSGLFIASLSCLPTVACKDATLYLDAHGNASLSPADLDNGSDLNGGSLSLSQTQFTCADLGANAVTLTATNAAGSSSCTATVTVIDNLAPVAVCRDITVALDPATGSVSLAGADIDGGSSDNCAFTMTASPNLLTCADVGTNAVILTVTDGSGNTASCTAQVTVTSDLTVHLDQSCVSITTGYGPQNFATVSATASGGSGSYTYLWSNGMTGAAVQVSPSATSSYAVTVTDAHGCTAAAGSVQVIVTDVSTCHPSGTKVTVCHVPPGNPAAAHEICIAPAAVPAHLGGAQGHGTCHLGPCQDPCSGSLKQFPGILPQSADAVRISPNPGTGIFRIQTDHSEFSYEVVSLDGRVLLRGNSSGNQAEADLRPFPAGSYLLSITREGVRETHTLLRY